MLNFKPYFWSCSTSFVNKSNEFLFNSKVSITLQVINGLYTGVTTQELDTLAAETAAAMTTEHADYAVLAARISVSNLHKETKKTFSGKQQVLDFIS